MRIGICFLIACAMLFVSANLNDDHSTGAAKSSMLSQKKSTEKAGKVAPKDSEKSITGKVIRVGTKEKTFVLSSSGKEMTFDGSKLKSLPSAGTTVDVIYTESASGQLLASVVSASKETAAAADARDAPQAVSGKVVRVNQKEKTFVIQSNGKESTVAAGKQKTLPKVGDTVNLTPNNARFIFNSCEECNAKCPGVCFLSANYCRCYLMPIN